MTGEQRAVYAAAALRVASAAFAGAWAPVLSALNGRTADVPSVAAAREAVFKIERLLSEIERELRRLQG